MLPELRTIKTCSYDKRWGLYGRYTDWVTETEYIDDKSLTVEELQSIVEKHHEISGSLKFRKFRLTYADGTVLYKHILEEVMY